MNKKTEPKKVVIGPALEEAYQFVIPSYGWMNARYDAINGRIQTLVAFTSTLTFAGVVLAASVLGEKPDYSSSWFVAALGLATMSILIGLWGRSHGAILLPDPGFDEEELARSPQEFKTQMMAYASRHFSDNSCLIDFKSRIADGLTILLAVEVGLLFLWALP